jgi:peptidoglycan/xylan/chitin deacetylase (PgdA/CDA1 family)
MTPSEHSSAASEAVDLDFERLRTGRYEAERLPSDFTPERVVPDFGFSVLNERGHLYDTVADRAALGKGVDPPSWPGDSEFAVCLTHDVDLVSARSLAHALRETRRTAGLQLSTGAPGTATPEMERGMVAAAKTLGRGVGRAVRAVASSTDPLHCYERWLAIEREVGAKSSFFFMPDRVERPHKTDNDYRYDDRVVFDGRRVQVSEMISAIDDRGWEVGLHPSWYTYDDAKALAREKRQLERVIGGDVRSVRQHYLHYDVRTTPAVHESAGFEFDSSLGFNYNVGFRFGTSWPWHVYDLERETNTAVLEVPLAVQDGALFGQAALGLDERGARRYIERLTAAVREVGGVLTLLWHPSTVTEPRRFDLYRWALEYLAEEGAWFGTVAEVGDHWLETRT